MTTKHTPGPWAIDTETRSSEVCTIYSLPKCETNGQGFTFIRGAFEGRIASEDENMANARLIAAAPDLLAVVEELEESSNYWCEYDVPLGIVDRIRAAIEKATKEL